MGQGHQEGSKVTRKGQRLPGRVKGCQEGSKVAIVNAHENIVRELYIAPEVLLYMSGGWAHAWSLVSALYPQPDMQLNHA